MATAPMPPPPPASPDEDYWTMPHPTNTPSDSHPPRQHRRAASWLLVVLIATAGCVAFDRPEAATRAPQDAASAPLPTTPQPAAQAHKQAHNPASGKTAASLMEAIQAEIGDARCDNNAQCRTLPVGSKACGGPRAWLAWSTRVGREARLRELAQAHARASQAEDEKLGRFSDCAVQVDPGARCEAGHCVTKSLDLPLQPRPPSVQ